MIRSKGSALITVLLVIVILAVGVGVLVFLAQAKEAPPREDEKAAAMVVEVEQATNSAKQVTITAMGTVKPSREVTLYPEVNGRITKVSDKLVPGGRFGKNETVLRIDPKQYELALAQNQANVAQAKMELSMEQGRKSVAEREWHLIEDEIKPTEEGKRLALREIQLETAEASLEAAKSNLEIARLNRTRTTIKAPFNALVTKKSVDLGQVVGPGSPLITLVDADAFWIQVSIPVHQLPWIHIPGVNAEEGSQVTVKQEISDELTSTYEGRVMKLLGGVDPNGKMAQIIIEVLNPLEPMSTSQDIQNGNQTGGKDLSFPLLLEALVEVEIVGPTLNDVLEIPRHTVRNGDKVWVLTDDRKLTIKDVSILWTRDSRAFVKGELKVNDHIITSRIDTPVEGMSIRLEGEDIKADGGTEEDPESEPGASRNESGESESASAEQSK